MMPRPSKERGLEVEEPGLGVGEVDKTDVDELNGIAAAVEEPELVGEVDKTDADEPDDSIVPVEKPGLEVGVANKTEPDDLDDCTAPVGTGTSPGQVRDAPGLVYSFEVGGIAWSNIQSYCSQSPETES
jgi:hypothetical protein